VLTQLLGNGQTCGTLLHLALLFFDILGRGSLLQPLFFLLLAVENVGRLDLALFVRSAVTVHDPGGVMGEYFALVV